jgi:hypothetical protein
MSKSELGTQYLPLHFRNAPKADCPHQSVFLRNSPGSLAMFGGETALRQTEAELAHLSRHTHRVDIANTVSSVSLQI